jgi:hypothetical protein
MPARANEEVPVFFNAKEIGLSFKKMTVDTIQTTSQEVTSTWFHSDCDAELYLFKDKNTNIIKQQLFFCGQIVEWNIVEGLKTGAVFETEKFMGAQIQEDLVMDEDPVKLSIIQAKDIVSFVDKLVIVEKDEILLNYVEAPKLSLMKPSDLAKKYSASSNNKTPLFYRFLNKIFK